MTAGDHYPQLLPDLGGGVLVACLSDAGCLLAWVWLLVMIWSVWVVQVNMDDVSDCQLY